MPVITKSPNGDDIVILSRQEYEDLTADKEDRTLLLAAIARRELGQEEYLTTEEADEYVAAKTPLAFWRKKRGLTMAALAAQAGIAEDLLYGMEDGDRPGNTAALDRIAAALNLTQDDLTVDSPAS